MKLTVSNLHFQYAHEPVLKGISLNVEKGDMVALIGPNGSGKSTLLKCLTRILAYQKGFVTLDGRDIAAAKPAELARQLAYVPQHELKISGITVFDTVLAGRKPYIQWGPSAQDYTVVAETLESLGISPIAMKDVSQLSGGQQQLVYIARALVQATDTLLLDEPTNNLDIRHQIDIMELLGTLSAQGKTLLITLHDLNLAIRYCQKFILLNNGELVAQGGKEVISLDTIQQVYGINMRELTDQNDTFFLPF